MSTTSLVLTDPLAVPNEMGFSRLRVAFSSCVNTCVGVRLKEAPLSSR